jgi:hypothetical protein
MDSTALVANSEEIEGLVVEALSRDQVPATAVDWVWVPQFESSQLVVVTPLYDSKGPRQTYARILAALREAGVYQTVPINEIVALSPQDPLAQELVRQLKHISEGALHLVGFSRNGHTEYSVVLTPYSGKGGAIPSVRFRDQEQLRRFLENRLGVLPYLVGQALDRLRESGRASIFNVRLNLRKAKKLKLAA